MSGTMYIFRQCQRREETKTGKGPVGQILVVWLLALYSLVERYVSLVDSKHRDCKVILVESNTQLVKSAHMC